jgi:flagellar protein FlaG
MDVSALRPPDPVETAAPRRAVPPARATTTDADPPAARPGGWVPPSLLKFTLTAADVDARFEIHEATDTVTVTMYDRATGEVLREVPSRDVLDVIASLQATGLRVDAIT